MKSPAEEDDSKTRRIYNMLKEIYLKTRYEDNKKQGKKKIKRRQVSCVVKKAEEVLKN